MKTFKLDAAKIDFENNPFTGSIDVKIPNVKERMDIFKDMDMAKVVGDNVSPEAGFDILSKMSEYIVAIDVTVDEERITDVDELTCYAEGNALFQAAGQYVMNGLPLGNDLRLR